MITAPDIDALEEEFQQLRLLYEKYFRGIDRIEPQKPRDDYKRKLRRLIGEYTPNTARRFRLQTLQASLVTHEQYWNRIARQIEEGTFKRDKLRAAKLTEAAADKTPQAPAGAAAAPPDAAGSTAAATAATPAAAADSHPPSIRKLHAAYERASLQGGGGPVSIDALAATVRKQAAAIKEKYQCQSVEFRVVVQGGKPVLKAIPKK